MASAIRRRPDDGEIFDGVALRYRRRGLCSGDQSPDANDSRAATPPRVASRGRACDGIAMLQESRGAKSRGQGTKAATLVRFQQPESINKASS